MSLPEASMRWVMVSMSSSGADYVWVVSGRCAFWSFCGCGAGLESAGIQALGEITEIRQL